MSDEDENAPPPEPSSACEADCPLLVFMPKDSKDMIIWDLSTNISQTVTVKDLPFNFHDGVNWIGLDYDTIFFCGNEENSPESAFSFNYTTNNLARLADMKKGHMNHGCLKYE